MKVRRSYQSRRWQNWLMVHRCFPRMNGSRLQNSSERMTRNRYKKSEISAINRNWWWKTRFSNNFRIRRTNRCWKNKKKRITRCNLHKTWRWRRNLKQNIKVRCLIERRHKKICVNSSYKRLWTSAIKSNKINCRMIRLRYQCWTRCLRWRTWRTD